MCNTLCSAHAILLQFCLKLLLKNCLPCALRDTPALKTFKRKLTRIPAVAEIADRTELKILGSREEFEGSGSM